MKGIVSLGMKSKLHIQLVFRDSSIFSCSLIMSWIIHLRTSIGGLPFLDDLPKVIFG